jgi:hypothetical protein
VEVGFTQVGAAQPDPASPGRLLRLYDVPEDVGVMVEHRPARVLVVSEPSTRSGRRRHPSGMLVPGGCPDALTAMARTFGLGADEYAAAEPTR